MGFFMSEADHDTSAVSLDFVLENPRRLYQGLHNGELKQLFPESCDYRARRVTFTPQNSVTHPEVPFEEVSELRVLPEDSADFVYAHRDYYIKATVAGVEGVFYAAEHFNLGRGHMMLEREGKIRGVVASVQLENPVALEPRETGFRDSDGLVISCGTSRSSNLSALKCREEMFAGRRYFSVEEPPEYAMSPAVQVSFTPGDKSASAQMEEIVSTLRRGNFRLVGAIASKETANPDNSSF